MYRTETLTETQSTTNRHNTFYIDLYLKTIFKHAN